MNSIKFNFDKYLPFIESIVASFLFGLIGIEVDIILIVIVFIYLNIYEKVVK